MLRVGHNEFYNREEICVDFSGALIQEATNFRNEPGDEHTCFESALRKIGTELAYPVLMVAVVVEHLVRIALSLFLLIPSCCTQEGCGMLGAQIYYSVLAIPDHLIRCAVGMFKNIFVAQDLSYKDLGLCSWKC